MITKRQLINTLLADETDMDARVFVYLVDDFGEKYVISSSDIYLTSQLDVSNNSITLALNGTYGEEYMLNEEDGYD